MTRDSLPVHHRHRGRTLNGDLGPCPTRRSTARAVGAALALALGATMPAATVALPTAQAATSFDFTGTFSAETLTLRLEPSTDGRYVGTLTDGTRTYPVVLRRRSPTVLAGVYVAGAVEHPLVVTRVGEDVSVVRNGVRVNLARAGTANGTNGATGALAAAALDDLVRATGAAGGVAAPLFTSNPLFAGGITFPRAAPVGGAAAATADDAPAFVRTGMRLTYEVSSSSSATADGDTDPSGGVGLEQLTITGVRNGVAAVESRLLAIDLDARAVWHLSSDGYVFPLADGGEYWSSPRKLAAMPDGTQEGVTVVHGPYTLNGTTYSAVRITTPTKGGSTQYTFDVDSGMLLIWGIESVAGNGARIISQKRFLSMRQTSYPWAGQTPKSAVTTLKQADWSGTYRLAVDTFDGSYPITQGWTVRQVDALTARVDETTTLDMNDGRGPQTTTAAKVRPISSLWIDPTILAKLRKGQVIDDDRVTGLRTTVASVADGMVVFTEIGAIQSISSGFDLRTGSVVAVQAEHRTKAVTTSIYLQRTR